MATNAHYDVIIIGSGAGGGTLAHALAGTGKRILLLERAAWAITSENGWGPRRRAASRSLPIPRLSSWCRARRSRGLAVHER
jgi:choline dehydrogenase-like flavoprotein